jgi:hypothetical protein
LWQHGLSTYAGFFRAAIRPSLQEPDRSVFGRKIDGSAVSTENDRLAVIDEQETSWVLPPTPFT